MFAAKVKPGQRLDLAHQMVFVFFWRRPVAGIQPQLRLGLCCQSVPGRFRVGAGKGRKRAMVKLAVMNFCRRRRPVLSDLIKLFLHILIAANPAVVVGVRIRQRCMGVATALVRIHNQPVLAVRRIAANGVAD